MHTISNDKNGKFIKERFSKVIKERFLKERFLKKRIFSLPQKIARNSSTIKVKIQVKIS